MLKDGGLIDQKTISHNNAVNDDKIDDLNKEDVLHLQDSLANNNNDDDNDNNNIKHDGVINQQDEQENHFGAANNNPQVQKPCFGGVNEHNLDNIDKEEEQGKGFDEGQNQHKDNNNHVQISEDEEAYVDHEVNEYDSNDNQQHDYDSQGNWDNEPNIDRSEDNNDCDPNDIGQVEDAATISRKSHNMSTCGNRLGNIVCGQPSTKTNSGLDGPH